MDKKQAEAEIKYRLIKMILSILAYDGVLDKDEIETVRKKAVRKLKPIIGSLE